MNCDLVKVMTVAKKEFAGFKYRILNHPDSFTSNL